MVLEVYDLNLYTVHDLTVTVDHRLVSSPFGQIRHSAFHNYYANQRYISYAHDKAFLNRR